MINVARFSPFWLHFAPAFIFYSNGLWHSCMSLVLWSFLLLSLPFSSFVISPPHVDASYETLVIQGMPNHREAKQLARRRRHFRERL